jgi:NitT/TauT family transport system substrate-binding protein
MCWIGGDLTQRTELHAPSRAWIYSEPGLGKVKLARAGEAARKSTRGRVMSIRRAGLSRSGSFHVFAVALAAVYFSGVGTALAAKIKMVFPGTPTTMSLPYFVAQKKGFLGDLQVEEVYVTGDANAMRVLLSGNADIATVGTLNVLTSIESGASVRAIHSWQPIVDYSLVLATGKGTSLADLPGKVFAASGPAGLPDQLPRMVMRKHGIDASNARFLQVGGHAARLQAVIGGRADATLVNTVTALKGVRDGKVSVLTRISNEFPGLGYVWNVVKTESMNDPQLSAAFETLTIAGIKGARYLMEHPDEAAEILHGRLPDLDLDFIKAAVRDLNTEKPWGVDGGIRPAIVEFTAKLNKELGNLKKDIRPSDVLDRRYVDAALKKIN